MVFRWEAFENVISKHELKAIDWRAAAKWAFMDKLNKDAWTIASVKMLDDDTVEIVKRNEKPSRSWFYTWGSDNTNLYERVIVNRSECSVAIDRLDSNYYIDAPFLGQRDHFYVENVETDSGRKSKRHTPHAIAP